MSEGGTLYVVATPIGNLGDVTLRAIEVLGAVPTDRGRGHPDHPPPARPSWHHDADDQLPRASGPERRSALLAHLRGGEDLALVTDAGTPGVSDPGEELVGLWAAEGGRVVPIPGASAVLAAVVASGVVGPRWIFEGFLPRTGRDRRDRVATDRGR